MPVLGDKAQKYAQQLDSLRVSGDWSAFPETIRKLSKHAPSQTLLVATAKTEYTVATTAKQRSQDLSPEIQGLNTVLQSSSKADQVDVFQAESCLTWARSASGEVAECHISPENAVTVFERFGGKASTQRDSTATWTEICLIRSACIKIQTCLSQNNVSSTQAIVRPCTAWIEFNKERIRGTRQLNYWSEQVLAAIIKTTSPGDVAYSQYHNWIDLISKTQECSASTYCNFGLHIPRSAIWKLYYENLSGNLQTSTSPLPRFQQLADLREAETAYEDCLLRSMSFPKATGTNKSVENLVEMVIQNWQTLCTAGWAESDFGQGGRNAYTRSILDLLYRAAGKTFQSTLILRRLFQVHKALTEFELAYSCLDTYIDIIERTKARAAKAGETTHDEDSDETVLLTVAEGIEGLCAYGKQSEAQRAFNLGVKMQEWLDEHMPDEGNPEPPTNGHAEITEPVRSRPMSPLSSQALEIVYRSIAIATAQQARWTPLSEKRTKMQAQSINLLQKAVGLSDPQIQTVYALAVLAAETRDIPLALSWTKMALQRIANVEGYTQLRHYHVFWHLLSLLLSSQQEFETALQSSSVALEKRPLELDTVTSGEKYDFTGSASKMSCDDAQRILELGITRLALIELTVDVEAALNHSNELMSLYSSLFGHIERNRQRPNTSRTTVRISTAGGPASSVRGSMFSRRKMVTESIASRTDVAASVTGRAVQQTRPSTMTSVAPTIQVIDEAGRTPEKKPHHKPFHHHRDHRTSNGQRNSAINAATAANEVSHQGAEVNLEHQRIGSSTTGEQQQTSCQAHPEHVSSRRQVRPQFSDTVSLYHASMVLCNVWLVTAALYRKASLFDDAKEAIAEAKGVATSIEELVSAADPAARTLADAGWGGAGKSSDDVWADVLCVEAELLSTIAARKREDNIQIDTHDWKEIIDAYEQCLMYSPNHANGIVGLSNVLLDQFERIIELHDRPDHGVDEPITASLNGIKLQAETGKAVASQLEMERATLDHEALGTEAHDDLKKTPENLNRIAARDRAYGLLSILTKSGHGWDNSEAWFALARAHELGGEIDKAKDILWWCTELEDTRPIRHWRNLSCNGYVL